MKTLRLKTLLLYVAPDADPVQIHIDETLPTFSGTPERVAVFDAQAQALAWLLRESLPQGVYERLATQLVMSMTTNFQTKMEVE